MISINKKPLTLTDCLTNKDYDVYWLNFEPFCSEPYRKESTPGHMYWPEFLINEEYVPGRIWEHEDKLWEDKVFKLYCDVHKFEVFVRIQLYWNDKYPGYLVFRPYTIENNLEVLRRVGGHCGTK